MDWKDFLNNLKPETNHQGSLLLESLSSLQTIPDIFWYPGSGKDLVPLLLDVPNNPTHERLYRINQESNEKPLLFWMNDYSDYLKDFPEDNLLGQELVTQYDELWKAYDATATIGKNRERYRIINRNVKITLFTVNIRHQVKGIHAREETSDEYLVCFSSCDSELLLENVFVSYSFHLSVVALIKQGGFSCQRENLDQYKDLPDRVAKFKEKIGLVDFWITDSRGQSGKEPAAHVLREYEYIGGILRWGWSPARLYGRPGCYSCEKRKMRSIMARTAQETASTLIKIYNKSFANVSYKRFRIGWSELCSIAGIPNITDEYMHEIQLTLRKSGHTLIQLDNFLVVALESYFSPVRAVPPRIVEQYLPGVEDDDGDTDDENPDFSFLETDD